MSVQVQARSKRCCCASLPRLHRRGVDRRHNQKTGVMMQRDQAVQLAQQLVRIPTSNPPGSEQVCAGYLGNLMAKAGFEVTYHEFSPGRTSVIARLGQG